MSALPEFRLEERKLAKLWKTACFVGVPAAVNLLLWHLFPNKDAKVDALIAEAKKG
jgi:hypothetical protein